MANKKVNHTKYVILSVLH